MAEPSLGDRLVAECLRALLNLDLAPVFGYWNAAPKKVETDRDHRE